MSITSVTYNMHPFQIRHAATIIQQSGVIACPTESVFGLSCHPLSFNAVSKILALKHRSADKGLILVASSVEQLHPFIEDPEILNQKNVRDSWPGPTSWLVPASAATPAWLTGTHTTIALRVTDHPVMAKICNQCGHALVSTSANISTRPAAVTPLQVHNIFGNALDWILHAETGHNKQVSTIADAVSGRIIRS